MKYKKSVKLTSLINDEYILLGAEAEGLFRRRGQAALEYILVFAALVAAVCAAVHFMRSPRDAARYTTDVICSERF